MNFAEYFIESCKSGKSFNKDEWIQLLGLWQDSKIRSLLRTEAVRIQKEIFGDKIYVRGLIEFSNYCKNDCYYCGIRRSNHHACRYRLTKEEILSCCQKGYELGFRTFVLQGGEDPYYTDAVLADLVSSMKKEYTDCAVTLSVGERTKSSYFKLKKAGADRYLLRHETANQAHYELLHPDSMKFSERIRCLKHLKELGFQTGAGFMVGSPGQSLETLADDMMFLSELKPEMAGIGPFIPHHDTVFANENAGSVEQTLFLLSVVRILLPSVLLPATTALGTMASNGREQGILHGANVIMPNLSPVSHRKKYELYDNKVHSGEEAAEGMKALKASMKKIGYEIVIDRGDAPVISVNHENLTSD